MFVARRFLISGRVQGVGFRAFAYDAARREGVSGSARNLVDGRVEVVAEGEAEAIERLERALQQGPVGAYVSDVETEALPPTGRHPGFHIRG
jgi:acylphosphatase